MKLKSLLQKLIVIVAVILLIACLVTGMPMGADNASLESFMWMITLMVCIGAVLFPISEKEKPLDWILIGSFLGSCTCLCGILGLSDKVLYPVLFFVMYLLELLLSIGYRIGRRFGTFD